jgi:beta-galactosidase
VIQELTQVKPGKIELHADRKVMRADGKDISYITISLLCEKGEVINNEHLNARCYISGDAHIVSMETDFVIPDLKHKTLDVKLNTGRVLLVLQSGKNPQIVTVTVIAAGLPVNSLKIKICRNN